MPGQAPTDSEKLINKGAQGGMGIHGYHCEWGNRRGRSMEGAVRMETGGIRLGRMEKGSTGRDSWNLEATLR